MAESADIAFVISHLRKDRSADFFATLNQSAMGMAAVLSYLQAHPEGTTTGAISRNMNVSSARMAVLLRKLEEKGYIERTSSQEDGRVIMVRLTGKGQAESTRLQGEIRDLIGSIIDRIGMQRMREYIQVSEEIQSAAASFRDGLTEDITT